MVKFLDYNPEQAYLLAPTLREVLGEGRLCFSGGWKGARMPEGAQEAAS
jgi:hypothetical protein